MHLSYKKYGWKRITAALGAALMLLQTPLGHLPVLANTAEQSFGKESVSDNSTVSDNSVQPMTEQTEVLRGELALGYVYIEKAQLEADEMQNILISLGEGSVAWERACLTLEHTETGEEMEIPVTQTEDHLLRFAMDTEGLEAGVYRVSELTYSYVEDGVKKEGTITFAEIENMEQVCFGLGVSNPLKEAEFTQYDAQGNVAGEQLQKEEVFGDSVVSLRGSQENITAADKVAEAFGNADIARERKVAGSLVVMLDPGHDDTHAGTRANGLEEEDLTFKVAEYCKEYLEDNYSDVVVYLSRPGEACPHPGTTSGDCNAYRVADAFEKQADVYVSLHFNATAGGSTTASGAIVFYPNSNYDGDVGSEGATLAAKIIEELEKIGLKNNGIRIRNSENNTTYPDGSLADYYGVIRLAKEKGIPAVIVEHAFVNNASDAAFLKEEKNIKKLGIADALGIAKAYKLSTEEVEFDAEDLKVSEIDTGNGTFKITLSGATPTARINKIKFKVYPTADKTKSYTYTAEADKEVDGVYTAVANVSNHGKLTGEYKVIAYAYDAAGKKTQLRSTTATIEQGKVETTGMKLSASLSKSEKKATITLKGNANAANVYFKVYSKDGGKDDIKKYTAVKQANGNWKASVSISKHKSMGEYVVLAYSTSYFGKSTKVKTGSFIVEGPTVDKLYIKKFNLEKGTFQVRAKGIDSKSGVKKIQIVVEGPKGSKTKKTYNAKKSKSGYYYADVDLKSFKYVYGNYTISVKVKDGNGINEIVKTYVKEVEKPEPVLSMKLKSKQTKLSMTASNLGISASVKGVKFKVYHSSATSKKKTYVAKKKSDGSYNATMKISDFKKSGKYKVITYVKGADGKYKKVGKTQTVTVSDIKGGKVKTKKKTSTSNYLYVSNIDYKGSISKVQVKVWPKSKTSAKKTYTAKLLKSGSYRVTINTANHGKKTGEYSYQVTVTAKNGIKKKLLKGTFTFDDGAEDGELYAISGTSSVTVAQMVSYYKKNSTYPTFYSVSDAPTLKKFCQMYYDECEAEGIRAEVAFAQAMKETNFLRYGGDVNISQYNFAGLGATGGGEPGLSFATVRQGIRAQVQHLKAYANNEALNQTCVDPRFKYVQRGCAPYVEWLGISTNPYGKGWATDPTYGSSLRKMIMAIRDC